MKLYSTGEKGLRAIMEFVKKSNPPDGMTREEWIKEFRDILVKYQIIRLN